METVRDFCIRLDTTKVFAHNLSYRLEIFDSLSLETQAFLENEYKNKIPFYFVYKFPTLYWIFALGSITIFFSIISGVLLFILYKPLLENFFLFFACSFLFGVIILSILFKSEKIVDLFVELFFKKVDKSEKLIEKILTHGRRIDEQKRKTHELELDLANTKNNAMLEAYRKQLELLYEYKSKGMDIERETFAMRKELLELEKSENKEMIDDLLNTLDRL